MCQSMKNIVELTSDDSDKWSPIQCHQVLVSLAPTADPGNENQGITWDTVSVHVRTRYLTDFLVKTVQRVNRTAKTIAYQIVALAQSSLMTASPTKQDHKR